MDLDGRLRPARDEPNPVAGHRIPPGPVPLQIDQVIRYAVPIRVVRTLIVYHSHSGRTHALAEQVCDASGGDLVEVKPQTPYGMLSVYSRGTSRARHREADAIDPAVIDAAAYDRIVIGTPVWGGHPTPVINGAVAALQGAEGKSAVLFATCGYSPGESFPVLRAALAARGVNVIGEFSFARKELGDIARIGALVEAVRGGESG